MIDIREPALPRFAGCYSEDGYVHDTQCIVYVGPDTAYLNHEICFCYDEDTLTIVDVSDKSAPKTLAVQGYQGYQYTHQGWLLPGNPTHLLLDDELDELYGDEPHTRTLIWDVSSLTSPREVGSFYSKKTVIDHNQYTLGNRVFQANYCGGLRILDTTNAKTGVLREVGYFDVSPDCNEREFLGSWSNYPYLPSGNILISSIDRGLFVVKYNGASLGCD